MCGLSLTEPIEDGIEIPDEHIQIIEGLINHMINHWPAVGASSIDGFSGNWLVRDGLLSEQDDRWYLAVDKTVYVVLLNNSHFSMSIIKYPWMAKPLHVYWPY